MILDPQSLDPGTHSCLGETPNQVHRKRNLDDIIYCASRETQQRAYHRSPGVHITLSAA